MHMKRIVIILIGLISVAYGQSSPTSSKTRFVNGLYVGTKLDAYFNTADSNAIYWRADSALMAKYKGTARALAFAVSGGYIPYSDTTSLFSQVVRTFGTQTVGGNKTFSNDIVVSGAYLGRRNARNIIFGGSSLGLNTTGLANTAIGDTTLFNNTSGNENTAIGYFSMRDNTTGAFNTAIGSQSLLGNTTGETNIGLGGRTLLYNTTGSRNIGIGYGAGEVSVSGTNTTPNKSIYIGYLTRPSAANQTNQIVIGDSAIGNGSNTVTIGNSSVTDNYFSGNVRSTKFTVGSPTDATRAFAASGNGNDISMILEEYISSINSPELFLFKGRGSVLSKSNIQSADGLGLISFGGYVNSNLNVSSNIGFLASNINTTNNYADADFVVNQTYNSTTFNENLRLSANGGLLSLRGGANIATTSGNVLIGTTSNSEGAKLKVDGGYAFIKESGGADVYFRSAFDGTNAAIQVTSASDLDFATSNVVRMTLSSSGDVTAPNVYTATVGATNRDVFVDNTGLIGYVSSFRASKKNIAPISNTDWLHSLNPVTFNYRVKDSLGNYTDSAYKELEYGLVAEEVETVNPEMVFYDVNTLGNKKLRGVHYSKLIIPLLAEVKEHKKKIDAQDKVIEALLTRIKALEAKLN